MEFAKVLMQEAEVAVAPGIGFGEYGEGYVRIGLVENELWDRTSCKKCKKVDFWINFFILNFTK